MPRMAAFKALCHKENRKKFEKTNIKNGVEGTKLRCLKVLIFFKMILLSISIQDSVTVGFSHRILFRINFSGKLGTHPGQSLGAFFFLCNNSALIRSII